MRTYHRASQMPGTTLHLSQHVHRWLVSRADSPRALVSLWDLHLDKIPVSPESLKLVVEKASGLQLLHLMISDTSAVVCVQLQRILQNPKLKISLH